MSKKILWSICFSMIVSALSKAEEGPKGIQEVWQEAYVYSSIGEGLTVGVLMNNLYNSHLGNYDWFVEGGIKYKINNWLKVEGLYRQEYYKMGPVWTYENRPMVRLSGSKSLGIWKVRNRQRFEMRFFEYGPSRFRYRTDLKVSPQWNMTSWDLNPYISEEVFVSKGAMSRVRSYLGIQGKKGRLEPSAYLLVQSNVKSNPWKHRLICGFCLGFEL